MRDKKYLFAFGSNLRKLREERSLSQEALANLADIGVNQIWKLENGELNPTVCTLKAIAGALKILPKDVLDFPF